MAKQIITENAFEEEGWHVSNRQWRSFFRGFPPYFSLIQAAPWEPGPSQRLTCHEVPRLLWKTLLESTGSLTSKAPQLRATQLPAYLPALSAALCCGSTFAQRQQITGMCLTLEIHVCSQKLRTTCHSVYKVFLGKQHQVSPESGQRFFQCGSFRNNQSLRI